MCVEYSHKKFPICSGLIMNCTYEHSIFEMCKQVAYFYLFYKSIFIFFNFKFILIFVRWFIFIVFKTTTTWSLFKTTTSSNFGSIGVASLSNDCDTTPQCFSILPEDRHAISGMKSLLETTLAPLGSFQRTNFYPRLFKSSAKKTCSTSSGNAKDLVDNGTNLLNFMRLKP